MRISNHWSARKLTNKGEVNTKPSQTVPNQSLSVKEIITRFTQGRPLPSNGEPWYTDEYLPNMQTLDLVEIDQVKEAQQQRIDDLTNIINARKAAKKAADEAASALTT